MRETGWDARPQAPISPNGNSPDQATAARVLTDLFAAAVAAARPGHDLARALPPVPKGRTVVVGAGKAAAAMAKVVEDAWPGPLSGLVVVPYDHATAVRRIAVIEAAHPNPDAAGTRAAARILDGVRGLGGDDLVLALFSGGGSALLALPAPGLTLADKQAVTRGLLRCGASIGEINCVRKHLSAIKGGRLAKAAAPAAVHALLISDVACDDPAVIASGPTIADPTTFADARRVIASYGLAVPAAVHDHLEAAACETPKPGDLGLARAAWTIVASAQTALDAAATAARAAGLAPVVLGAGIEGEAREVARVLAAIARQVADHGQPAPAPCVLLSGGETTVTVRGGGGGRGGRNTEFLLALMLALGGHPRIWAIACDTDGIDGTERHAGAILKPDSLARAASLGLDPHQALANNDSFAVFAALGDLITTGPTLTNVNDFRAIFIAAAG